MANETHFLQNILCPASTSILLQIDKSLPFLLHLRPELIDLTLLSTGSISGRKSEIQFNCYYTCKLLLNIPYYDYVNHISSSLKSFKCSHNFTSCFMLLGMLDSSEGPSNPMNLSLFHLPRSFCKVCDESVYCLKKSKY